MSRRPVLCEVEEEGTLAISSPLFRERTLVDDSKPKKRTIGNSAGSAKSTKNKFLNQ